MAHSFNRSKASLARVPDPESDKEAWAILALNDAAARSRQGKFYYLPESREPFMIPRTHHEPVLMNSIVPRLLHADHMWKEDEVKKYRQLDDKGRYDYVQETTSVDLESTNVLPINLVIHATGMASLCWPTSSLATVVIYGHVYGGVSANPSVYRLSMMSEWIEKATKNDADDTYTVPMFKQGCHRHDKVRFQQTVNSLGKARGPEDIPSNLSLMLKKEGRNCTWVTGSDVLKELALEAKGVGGGGVPSTTEVLKDGGKGLSGAISGLKIKVES